MEELRDFREPRLYWAYALSASFCIKAGVQAVYDIKNFDEETYYEILNYSEEKMYQLVEGYDF